MRASRGVPLAWLTQLASYTGDDCVYWPFSPGSDGYGRVMYEDRLQQATRVACIIYHGQPPTPEYLAIHSCNHGKQGCCTPNHLSWGIFQDNSNDRIRHGNSGKGRANANCTDLPDETIAEIKALRGTMRQVDIATKFGISQPFVSSIQLGKTFRK